MVARCLLPQVNAKLEAERRAAQAAREDASLAQVRGWGAAGGVVGWDAAGSNLTCTPGTMGQLSSFLVLQLSF